MAAAPLAWNRDGDFYRAVGREGDRWHVVQEGSRWEVYRNSELFADWPNTLNDAKWAAEEEDDPAARERAAGRAAKRAATRAARRTARFKRVGPGVYDSEDGRFTLYRIEGVYPPAWNVEYHTDFINRWVDEDPENRTSANLGMCLVDGAASKRDALLLFAEASAKGVPA